MKNIILFFLLMAFTTTQAQYSRKHAGSHLSLTMHPTASTFNIKTAPVVALPQTASEQFLFSHNGVFNMDTPITPTKNFVQVPTSNQYIDGEKPLHSTYVYDLKGRVVTSKLSYRLKTKH